MEIAILFIAVIFIVSFVFYIWITSHDDNEESETTNKNISTKTLNTPPLQPSVENKENPTHYDITHRNQILGNILGEIIIYNAEQQHKMLHSVQEKMEMCYLLLLETDRIVFNNFREHHTEIMDVILKHVLIDSRGLNKTLAQSVLNEYNDRVYTYMSCKELISTNGATIGTKAFTLSHFLQKARGKTSGRDVMDVIFQKRELKPEDINEFLDFMEMAIITFSFPLSLNSIKHTIDTLKDLPENELKSKVYVIKQKLSFLRMNNMAEGLKSVNFTNPSNKDINPIKNSDTEQDEENDKPFLKNSEADNLERLKEKLKNLEIEVLKKRIKDLEDELKNS